MLMLKPNCECCDRDLGPGASDARICVCPNCGGAFVPRPIRPAALLAAAAPSTQRYLREQPCRAPARP